MHLALTAKKYFETMNSMQPITNFLAFSKTMHFLILKENGINAENFGEKTVKEILSMDF